MNTLHTLIIVVQVISALSIIGLVLVQHGKGADMGAAFGSGASGSLFGASGSSNFLSKSTAVAAAIFFAATMGLAFLAAQPATESGGVMDRLPESAVPGAIDNAVPGAVTPPAPAKEGAAPAGADPSSQIPQ